MPLVLFHVQECKKPYVHSMWIYLCHFHHNLICSITLKIKSNSLKWLYINWKELQRTANLQSCPSWVGSWWIDEQRRVEGASRRSWSGFNAASNESHHREWSRQCEGNFGWHRCACFTCSLLLGSQIIKQVDNGIHKRWKDNHRHRKNWREIQKHCWLSSCCPWLIGMWHGISLPWYRTRYLTTCGRGGFRVAEDKMIWFKL